MAAHPAPINDLTGLLHHELQDLYSAEKQILEALPKMIDRSKSNDLRNALEQHLQITLKHKDRLDEVSEMLGMEVDGLECKGMAGIINEGESELKLCNGDGPRDAAIISAAQRVEHYEMAGYGTARTFARQLGEDKVADLLQKTLNEEGDADHRLTEIAESKINQRAMV